MSALADFHDSLMPELPGCTAAMVNFHLRSVAIEFCRSTSVWQATLDAIDAVAAQATYTLTLPADSQLVRVTELRAGVNLLWRYRDREIADKDEQASPCYRVDEPPFDLNADLTQITLQPDEVPTADAVDWLLISVALTPTLDAAAVPEFLLTQYRDTLRAGTLARLMAMGRKPWTDRELSSFYRSEWESAKNFAAYQAQVGNTRRVLRVKKSTV